MISILLKRFSLALLCLFGCVLVLSAQDQSGRGGGSAASVFVATFAVDYDFNPVSDSLNGVYLRKINLTSEGRLPLRLDNWLLEELLNNAEQGMYECYSDVGLKNLLSKSQVIQQFIRRDTIVQFDLTNYEEKTSIIDTRIGLKYFSGLRCKQELIYDAKKEKYSTRLLAVAPLLRDRYTDGSEPIFWIKMDGDLPFRLGIESEDVSWSVLTNGRSAELQITWLKDYSLFWDGFISKMKDKKTVLEKGFYGSEDFEKGGESFFMVDTIYQYNEETQEETVSIAERLFEPISFRIVQEWYYDERKKKMYNRLKALAPICTVKDANGNELYQHASFYLHVED